VSLLVVQAGFDALESQHRRTLSLPTRWLGRYTTALEKHDFGIVSTGRNPPSEDAMGWGKGSLAVIAWDGPTQWCCLP
jgi:hypothetical protein